MTCALIARYKGEFFLREWIDYHKNIGFNHIFIAVDKDQFYLNDNDTSITLISCEATRSDIDCYNYILNFCESNYDYCAVCDINEFFDFKKYRTVQNFITKNMINNNFTVAEIPWEVYDDNDLIHHIEKPITELYIHKQEKIPFIWMNNSCSKGRSIFKLGKGVKTLRHWPNPESMNRIGGFKSTHVNKTDSIIKKYQLCLEDYFKYYVKDQNRDEILRSFFNVNKISSQKLLWTLRFLSDNKIKLSEKEKYWILNQFEKHPLLTVVVRTHNRLLKLVECIKSLKNQYYLGEILVLDDCSSDGTSKWLSENNISHVSLKTNVGPGEILARGKYLITTPFYVILDDDDIWKINNVFERFYEILIDNPYTDFIDTGYFFHVGYFISTELLLECPNLSLWCRDDWYFDWIRGHAKNPVKVSNFDFYGYTRTWNENNSSSSDQNLTNYFDDTANVSGDFYNERNTDSIINYINNNYYKGSERCRKVYDQILKYLNNKNN